MYSINLIIGSLFLTTIYCLPIENTINNPDTLIDNELKNPLSIDQALNVNSKTSKPSEETTTSNLQLFNNNEPEEDKLFKINDADELIDTSYLSSSSKQQSSGMPNVQSLIDQTTTISANLENMIKDMTTNKRHATAAMLRLMLQNVRRLNTSLVRLNNRVSSLPIIGNSPGSSSATAPLSSSSAGSSASAAASAVSSSVSNATINAATQINSVVSNIRNQLNNVSNEINNLLQRIRLSIPSGGSSSSKPTNSKPSNSKPAAPSVG